MKFYEPKPETPEDVNMSDDDSDSISTDGGSSPEYNYQNYNVNTSEDSSTKQNDGIVLYLRRLTAAQEVIKKEEEEKENQVEELATTIQTQYFYRSIPRSVFLQDLELDKNIQIIEPSSSNPNYLANEIYNTSTLQPGQQLSVPVAAPNFFNHDEHVLSPIASDDEYDSQDTEGSNSNDSSSDYLDQEV